MRRPLIRRRRNTKIVATLGPSTSTYESILAIFEAGVDVFRFNFSHGDHADHADRMAIVRRIEKEMRRPIGVMADMQGPKLRVGQFTEGKVTLTAGQSFRLDLDPAKGDDTRAPLPHKEIFAALEPGSDLLLDDGRIRLKVTAITPDGADTEVIAGGVLSDRKGVNVPGVLLPLSPLTAKDRLDLAFARNAARRRAIGAKTAGASLPPCRQARHRRDPNAGEHDHIAVANTGGSL